jgi:hypothetical protein
MIESPLMIQEAHRRKPKNVNETGYLQQLRDSFDLQRIYYPGCSDDSRTLSKVFKPEEIIYLDNNEYKRPVRGMVNFLHGDMQFSPFPDGTFDAFFYQDVHATKDALDDSLRTVKPNGIVIFSSDDCRGEWGMQLSDFEKHPLLEALSLPFKNRYYTSFRKIEPISK